MGELKKAILRTLAYADIFDYPLTLEEVWSYLVSQKKFDRKVVLTALKQMNADLGLISTDGKFYFVRGHRKIVEVRKKREGWSQGKLKIARRVANWFKLIPSIKMVAVTGALAMKNTDKDDDIDLLIVTSENRLWLTRLLTVFLVELVAKRRRPGDKEVKDKICLNMFLDGNHLAVPEKERDLFSAHEVCQLKPIWDRDDTYQKFIKANLWVKEFLPNAFTTPAPFGAGQAPRRWSQNKSRFTTPPRWGNLEALARRAQLWYMASRRTTEVVEPRRIRFHPQDAREWVLEEYQKRLKKFHLA